MIIFPCVRADPRAEELLDLHAPGRLKWFVDPNDDAAYARVLRTAWDGTPRFDDLIVIEQDIGIGHTVLPEFERCRKLWCAHAYPVQGRPVVALGCVRFTGELRAREPGLMDAAAALDVDGFGAGHWRRLDVAVDRELRRRGHEPHRHYPDVAHFHEY